MKTWGQEGEGSLDFTMKIAERSEQDLLPLKEDLAEWLSRVLQENITADNFMDRLENGVLVCKLAQIMQAAARNFPKNGRSVKPVSSFRLQVSPKCKSRDVLSLETMLHISCNGVAKLKYKTQCCLNQMDWFYRGSRGRWSYVYLTWHEWRLITKLNRRNSLNWKKENWRWNRCRRGKKSQSWNQLWKKTRKCQKQPVLILR